MNKNKDNEESLKYTSSGVKKLDQIDAVRGVAILLVIVCHAGGIMAELPYPVKKMTNFGWFGVQLFFIASAFTLLLSWHKQSRGKQEKILGFYLHRFFRIAPMYYLGGALYFFLRPPGEFATLKQLLLSIGFINSWSPSWIPTTDNAWMVVPGGWSISVEFCFYFVFPILATYCSSVKKSLIFLVLSFVLMAISRPIGESYWAIGYDEKAIDNFLYFWLPNQLVVFSLGFLVYFVVQSKNEYCLAVKKLAISHAFSILIIGILLFLVLTQLGGNHYFVKTFPYLPMHFLISIIFSIILVSLLSCSSPSKLVVNSFTVAFGKISFSAYVLHFGVLDLIKMNENLGFKTTGFEAIFYFLCVILPITLIGTFALSSITYRIIELPFINLGRKVTKRVVGLITSPQNDSFYKSKS